MQEFLQAIIDAHGGLERWNRLSSVELDLNFSGIVLEMKGFPRHLRPHCAIDLRSQRVVIQGIGAPTSSASIRRTGSGASGRTAP